MMNIRPTRRFLLAFLALTFVLHEAHEIAHISVGRWLCGCWPTRDFNVLEQCPACLQNAADQLAAGFAGPLFSFAVMWGGYFLLARHQLVRRKALGFALVFANMPFGRILTAALGGGDEVYNLKVLTGNFNLAWAVGLSLVVLLTAPPLLRAYLVLKNRPRIGWFLAFFLLPLVADVVVVLGGMNTLLKHGVLSGPGLLGSPVLVNVWTLSICLVLAFTYRHLYSLSPQPPVATSGMGA